MITVGTRERRTRKERRRSDDRTNRFTVVGTTQPRVVDLIVSVSLRFWPFSSILFLIYAFICAFLVPFPQRVSLCIAATVIITSINKSHDFFFFNAKEIVFVVVSLQPSTFLSPRGPCN